MKKGKYFKTFKLLLPYLWPEKRRDLRTRVSFAVVALILAKIASVSTPLVLGGAVNSLTELSSGINLFMLVPIALNSWLRCYDNNCFYVRASQRCFVFKSFSTLY